MLLGEKVRKEREKEKRELRGNVCRTVRVNERLVYSTPLWLPEVITGGAGSAITMNNKKKETKETKKEKQTKQIHSNFLSFALFFL